MVYKIASVEEAKLGFLYQNQNVRGCQGLKKCRSLILCTVANLLFDPRETSQKNSVSCQLVCTDVLKQLKGTIRKWQLKACFYLNAGRFICQLFHVKITYSSFFLYSSCSAPKQASGRGQNWEKDDERIWAFQSRRHN